MAENDTQPTQAMPTNDAGKVDPDDGASGRLQGGESGGGPYKDPDQVKPNPNNPGGQSHPDYSGPGGKDDGGGNPNAVAGS